MSEDSKEEQLTQAEQAKRKNALEQTSNNVEYYRNRSDTSDKPWYCITPYIDTEARKQNLKNHKYSGSDLGLSYIYFYNPVANKLVTCIPEWIAPNFLTVLGFIHTLVPMAVMFATQGPALYGPFPKWLCYVFAWCYFAYRMLDEMDGKQARRT